MKPIARTPAVLAAALALAAGGAGTAIASHGADDPAGQHQGRGADDPAGQHQGRGADDPAGHHRGKGKHHKRGKHHHRHGADDGPNHK